MVSAIKASSVTLIKIENSVFFQKLLKPVTWKLVDADN